MEKSYQMFTGLILNVSRCIQKIKNSEVAELGLKGKQVQCLFFLDKMKDGASLTQLCELCAEDKGAMSRTVKELTAKNLVYVEESKTQKYRNPIKLTALGQKNAGIVASKIKANLLKVTQGVTDSEREIFYKALTQYANNLNAICENFGGKND